MTAKLDTSIATLVNGYINEGLSLGELNEAIKKAWLAEKRTRRVANVGPKADKEKRLAVAAKAAKTRAENKKREEEGKKRWDEYLARVQKNTEALKAAMGPVLWKKYVTEEVRLAGNGDKEFTRLGVLQEVLGDNYKLVVAAAGLRGNFDF